MSPQKGQVSASVVAWRDRHDINIIHDDKELRFTPPSQGDLLWSRHLCSSGFQIRAVCSGIATCLSHGCSVICQCHWGHWIASLGVFGAFGPLGPWTTSSKLWRTPQCTGRRRLRGKFRRLRGRYEWWLFYNFSKLPYDGLAESASFWKENLFRRRFGRYGTLSNDNESRRDAVLSLFVIQRTWGMAGVVDVSIL